MMKQSLVNKSLVIGVIAVILLLACGSEATGPSAADVEELKQESQRLFDAWAIASDDGDIRAVYALLAPDFTNR